MEINTIKGIILVVLGLSTLIFSALPILLRKYIRHAIETPENRCTQILSLLSCFAGGVFMATGFLDLFPEVDDVFQKTTIGVTYPVPEYLTALGFFIALSIEQIVTHFRERNQASQQVEDPVNPPRDEALDGSPTGVSNEPLVQPDVARSTHTHTVFHHRHGHTSFRAILLASALSVHSIFEGLAIGLQPNIPKLLQIFLAVSIHKCVIGFSLGLKLVQSQLKLWTVIQSMLVFCLAAPIGLACALLLEEYSHSVNASIMNGILQGLACGTFFYVTFFEVLPHELNSPGNRLLKTLAIIVGFAIIGVVLILDPDNQGPGTSKVTTDVPLSTNLSIASHLM